MAWRAAASVIPNKGENELQDGHGEQTDALEIPGVKLTFLQHCEHTGLCSKQEVLLGGHNGCRQSQSFFPGSTIVQPTLEETAVPSDKAGTE